MVLANLFGGPRSWHDRQFDLQFYFPMITDRLWPNSLLSVKCSHFYWYETLVFFCPLSSLIDIFYVCYNANHILNFQIFKIMNDRRYDIGVTVLCKKSFNGSSIKTNLSVNLNRWNRLSQCEPCMLFLSCQTLLLALQLRIPHAPTRSKYTEGYRVLRIHGWISAFTDTFLQKMKVVRLTLNSDASSTIAFPTGIDHVAPHPVSQSVVLTPQLSDIK